MRTPTSRIAVGALVTLSALAALVGFFRSGWGRPPSKIGIPANRPSEFAASSSDFDVLPASMGVQAAVAKMDEAVSPLLNDVGLPAQAGETLRVAFRDRLTLLIEPDLAEWRTAAARYGTLPEGAKRSDPDEAAFIKKWESSVGILRHSPMSSRAVSVKRFSPKDGPVLGVPGTMFLRTGEHLGVSASYPDPPQDLPGVECYEIHVPMMFRTHSPGDTIPVTAVMRFYRKPGEADWRPADMFMYFDERAFGKGLATPLY
jgi:hypothetical protein